MIILIEPSKTADLLSLKCRRKKENYSPTSIYTVRTYNPMYAL